MLALDEDEAMLTVMALRYVADRACAQSDNRSLCDGAAKACVDGYCLPKMRELINRIQQWQQDEKKEADDANSAEL
jgi:hypothetical protein